LRLLEERDLPLTLAWRNQDHIRKWFLFSERITPEQHRAWHEKYRGQDNDFVFVIERRSADSQPVGQLSIYHIDWDRHTGEFGRLMIGEASATGKGLAREATAAAVSHALNHWVKELHLRVRKNNLAAIAIYSSCGFKPVEERDDLLLMSTCEPGFNIARFFPPS